MKLGILSDTHNNVANTRRALRIFETYGIERLIHCGDLTRPSMIEEFIGWRIDFVFGNNDDPDELKRNVRAMLPDCTIGEQWSTEIEGIHLGAAHGDDWRSLRYLVASGLYDIVFRGHSHERLDEMQGETRVINPGSLGGKKPQSRSVALLELPSGELTFIEIPD